MSLQNVHKADATFRFQTRCANSLPQEHGTGPLIMTWLQTVYL